MAGHGPLPLLHPVPVRALVVALARACLSRLRIRGALRAARRRPGLGRLRRRRGRERACETGDRRRDLDRRVPRAPPRPGRPDHLLGHEPPLARRHDDRAVRSGDDRGAREPPLRVRRVADPVRDAVDRAQRAERREPRDALDAEQRAVPRQRPQARTRARGARCAAVPADQLHAVHRDRRGRGVVACRRRRLRRRAGGLLQRSLARGPGAAAREPPTARRAAPRRRTARRDRHPRHADRPDARLPERGRDAAGARACARARSGSA